MFLSTIAALTVVLAATQPAPRDPALAPGIWHANDQVAPLDGRRTVIRRLYSVSDVPTRFGGPTVGILILRCAAGSREVMLAWPGAFFAPRSDAPVSWRVDESEIREELWQTIPGVPTSISSVGAGHLLDAIETGQQLVMRVQTHSAVQDLVFDLGDGAAAVQAVREACP